jgi:hypothetical protein
LIKPRQKKKIYHLKDEGGMTMTQSVNTVFKWIGGIAIATLNVLGIKKWCEACDTATKENRIVCGEIAREVAAKAIEAAAPGAAQVLTDNLTQSIKVKRYHFGK